MSGPSGSMKIIPPMMGLEAISDGIGANVVALAVALNAAGLDMLALEAI
jgi:hypothetical protein